MTPKQQLYDQLAKILTTTPDSKRTAVIRRFCKDNKLDYRNSKGQIIREGEQDTVFEDGDVCAHPLMKRNYLGQNAEGKNIVHCQLCKQTYIETENSYQGEKK